MSRVVVGKAVAKCVKCGAPLMQRDIWPIVPFPCPVCGTLLQTAEWYRRVATVAGFLSPMAAALAAGLRSWGEIGLIELVAFFPSIYIYVNFLKFVVPPKLIPGIAKDSVLKLR